ncbi:transmembrane protein 179B-like isoform X2 [Crassostrea virginica]
MVFSGEHVQLCVNTVLYFFIFVCGFAISIPLGVAGNEAADICLLYSTITFSDSGSQFSIDDGQKANCNFPIIVSVICCIFYALGMGIYHSYTIHKAQRDPSVVSRMWVLPFIYVNSLAAILMFICSCIISVGFKELCDSLTDKSSRTSRCSDFQGIIIYDENSKEQIGSLKDFYTRMNVSQAASWICTLWWILLVVSGIIRFVRDRRLQR